MIAVDSNVLVYAHRREARHGAAAYSLLAELAQGNDPWAIPWPCCYEFLSVVTNRKIWKEFATPAAAAWRQFLAWRESPSNLMIGEITGFEEVLADFVVRPHVVGGVIHDARIAALCVAHGVEALLSCDRDFALFPELRTRNPFRTQ